MPRKPFLPVFRSWGFAIGIGRIEQRPRFVEWIDRCITSWPFVERQLALLFGVILDAEYETAVTVVSVLRSHGKQKEPVKTAFRC